MSLASGLFTLWLLVLGWFWRQVRRLRVEVSYLPKAPRLMKSSLSPVLGLPLGDEVSFPPGTEGWPTAVLVTSAKCPSCHSEVEEFLHLYRERKIPFLCLLVKGEGDTAKFWEKNGRLFPIVEVERGHLVALGMTSTPTYYLTDPAGRVAHVVSGAPYVYKHMMRALERR